MNKVVVQGDQMYFYSKPNPIPSGQSQFSLIEFQFSGEWGWFGNKIAQFKQGNTAYNVPIHNGVCNPPSELCPGRCSLRIKGYNENAVIATANELIISVVQGFEIGGIPPVPPTPDLYQQLIEQFKRFALPVGGIIGQVLKKASNSDYDTYWTDESGGTSFDIHSLSEENEIADIDEMPFYDASETEQRKTTWSNIKGKLKAYFDGIYRTSQQVADAIVATVPAWARAVNKPTYTASEVGALSSDTVIPSALSQLSGDSTHRTVTDAEKTVWGNKQDAISDIDEIRDGAAAGATALQSESDPTVPAWAKQQTKPSYSKSEVGLGNVDNTRQYSASNPPPYPVSSVNGKTGTVNLGAADVGATTEEYVDGEVAEATTDMATQTWVKEKSYITAADIPVLSVNGKTGTVVLTAADLGLATVFNLKGSKPTHTALPSTDNIIGDVWYVVDESVGYIWLNDGTMNRWEQLGLSVDLSNYITTEALATALSGYVAKVTGKGLSTNDFTDSYKTKLDSAITSLAGYATEAWVEAKGYLTQHQSLDAYRTASAQDTIDAGKMPLVLGDLDGNHAIADSDYVPVAAAPDGDAERVNMSSLKSHINANNQPKITASGILKGNGSGGVSAAVAGTDYQAPIAFKTDPSDGIYQINTKYLSARYDYNADEITATYATKTELNGKLGTSGNGSNVTAAFTQASARANIATGEKLSVIFGKLSKWFADLKTVAFTGSYNDLSDKPTIPTVPTTLSAFTDDLGSSPVHTHSQYLTQHQSLAAYRTASAQDTIDNNQNTAINNKQNKPTLVTSGTNITLADNTEYRLTNVTSLTIAYPSGSFDCWIKITTASSGTISIVLPTSKYIGDVPAFANGETWELSIKDGVVVAGKVVSA